jgi:hypothetical protein
VSVVEYHHGERRGRFARRRWRVWRDARWRGHGLRPVEQSRASEVVRELRRCVDCAEPLALILVRLGSLRCHDCRTPGRLKT